MTTEAVVHPNIEMAVEAYRNELLKWVEQPGKVHVTSVVEILNGVPRKTLALGGHLKDEAISSRSICLTNALQGGDNASN